jgi:hypothetical protein
MAATVPLLTCTLEVPGSNLDRNTDFPEGFRDFPLSLEDNARIVP